MSSPSALAKCVASYHGTPPHLIPRVILSTKILPRIILVTACPKSGLIDLPFELLYAIAKGLCGTNDILNLARVNKNVSRVTREALIKELVIPRNHIKKLLETLIKHPGLIEKVNSVNFRDYGCGHHTECLCLGLPNFDPNTLKFLGKSIAVSTRGDVNWNEIRQGKRSSGPVWRKSNAFFMDIVISLCPNIKSITLELPEARAFDTGNPPRPVNLAPAKLPALNEELLPVTPFQGPALRLMQKNLEVLIILENSRWKGPAKTEMLRSPHDLPWRNMGRHTITLPGFAKLKRLDLPMDALGLPLSIRFLGPISPALCAEAATKDSGKSHEDIAFHRAHSPFKILPNTLTHLHLRSCGRQTFALLQKVNEIPVQRLNIVCIELFFKTRPRTSIAQCYVADEGKLNYPLILTELADKGVKVAFYTGPTERLFDMHKELVGLSYLSPLEAWRFALSGRQFSELDTKASMRRRSSILSSQLLMNTPTFDGSCWASVVFFHGIRNTKWDPNIMPQVVRRLQTLPGTNVDLAQFEFNFQITVKLEVAPSNIPHQERLQRSEKSKNDPKRGRRTDNRMKKSNKESDQTLKQHVAKLRLADNVEMSALRHTLGYEHSKFDDRLWSCFNWKFWLRPHRSVWGQNDSL
ncbi:uncharacterized protein K460DRAFT_427990 [Cucurbitaria berberidis CBS 394.84]|uniref:F-box domain-containing protein n=1 Tax=Cucurbitaria berberidis CBS 394.84 TaxID=1168544 RepID=A0A9P4GNW9_9PLEO|nr:uncharacterized protein K460DRAFT_427990 [Cucurbitaria berberidis CBS 394.84]KAF1848731.1 hypothetical protein K460DRAFT_427990 [Cucurbitaria berberidis CBS 394.84]